MFFKYWTKHEEVKLKSPGDLMKQNGIRWLKWLRPVYIFDCIDTEQNLRIILMLHLP